MNLLEAYIACRDLRSIWGRSLKSIIPASHRNNTIVPYEFEGNPVVNGVYRAGTIIIIKAGEYRIAMVMNKGAAISLSLDVRHLPLEFYAAIAFTNDSYLCYLDNQIDRCGISAYKCGMIPDVYRNMGHDLFDVRFTSEYLKQKLCGYKKGKECVLTYFLLDTTVCAHIDPSYLSEGLFTANINPNITIKKLLALPVLDEVLNIIIRGMRFAYSRGLDCFYDGGRKVEVDSLFLVNGRGGDACTVCGTKINCFLGIFWCPECQAEGALCNGV